MKQHYIPQPIDTSQVELPAELMALAEDIARNVHEVWAKGRMDEGWSYGPLRDDVQRLHPGLVPYEELTEAERDYDRRTAMQTLRLITQLGFKISKE